MSFSSSFDGFVVVHAAFLVPERRDYFEKEFARVGLQDYHVIETQPVTADDPRLDYYSGKANGILSLIDGFLAAIDLAESSNWNSLVIFEDDIIFSTKFVEYWQNFEPELSRTNWGVITLHRTPPSNVYVQSAPAGKVTKLVVTDQNTACQCVIVKREYFQEFRRSILEGIERGFPVDFFYGIFSHHNPSRYLASDRNLTGQRGGFKSSLQGNNIKRNKFSEFREAQRFIAPLINALADGLRRLKALRKAS
ncbi:MAG: hypothetical protein ACK5XZ_15310 [Hyphomonadaceae bacterium]|jgi:hypothetical protein|nr:hypothetical protein [Aquidulcibacter sp.]